MAWVVGIIIGAASLSASPPEAICTNSTIFSTPDGAVVAASDAGVETAGYTMLRDGKHLIVRENSIARKWSRARKVVLPDNRIVLRTVIDGHLTYAFPRLDDRSRPLLIISGDMLSGKLVDMALLKRFRITDWEVAEKDHSCTRVLHYGWDNVLGPDK